ncbi:hypothetical protein BA81_14486 [Bacillus safensis FO-36b]|uniref:stage II sporulation protein M n=1 Tax=Bacillus TaxID=1386 RepID=UPI00045D0A02|nr:hypothetical protein RS87_01255 [Bacillus safensis FO-36b]KDE26380.1 hypothetical protein BA81_14486 [Bacillus safensis FO-36b]KKD40672.1 hypothetical protein KU48_14975 [Bacillus safensis]
MLHNNKLLKKIIIIFSTSVLIGYIYGKIFLSPSSITIREIDYTYFISHITINNLMCILLMILISFLGSIFVKTFIIANGILIGLVISKFQSLSYLLLLIPHGLIEIPALLFLAYVLLQTLDRNKFDKRTLKGISVSVALILLGALVESFITPNLVISNFS